MGTQVPFIKNNVKSKIAEKGIDDEDVMKELRQILRGTRSLGELNDTHVPIKFHHTIDELNEDTLKNSNISGTLGVQKVPAIPSGRGNRRTGVFINSTTDPLHIDYNQPSIYNNHITDNKIEPAHNIKKYDTLVNEKLHNIINYTQNDKDKELSKLVVNELKRGTETIGDPKAPVTSNITFTPEKDTLTAMTFIAGNLLNKLWTLERDIDDSMEINNMRNQKIADLLYLFKEPMNYRQEIFLKDALEQLSEAVNKNKDNKHFSLCETMDTIKDKVVRHDTVQEVKKAALRLRVDSGESSANNALSKLIAVLDLIKKYEAVQGNLQKVKHPKEAAKNGPEMSVQNTTKDDKNSINLFGNILEKITNLLMPNINSKLKNKIRNQNMLRNSYHLDDDVKKTFNLNLDSMKLTSADKLILDYINKLQTNPCLSSNLPEDKSIRYKESDILLNLSEFFKIKSFSDLLKIVEPKPSSTPRTPNAVKDNERRSSNNDSNTEVDDSKNTLSINDKLKVHLKAIVNDLIELQHAKGKDTKSGEINIADALPCILKVLNQEEQPKSTNLYTNSALLNKIKNVLGAIKKDIRLIPLSRRSNMNAAPRPKSAVVWERLVKNLDENPKSTRRFFKIVKPQSYEAVKKLIYYLETNKSNTYKYIALRNDVPANDKLLFLKTLALDTGSYASVLGKLLVLNRDKKLPENELQDLIDFVDSAISNLELNKKVLNGLDETKEKIFNVVDNNNQEIRGSIKKSSDNSKAFGEQSMNQLIKNKVNQYLRMKESESGIQDVGYDIAQRILSNLERGSDKLARELYKILIETSQRKKNMPVSKQTMTRGRLLSDKRPIKLEDPSTKQRASEDMFLKTLESAWANLQSV